jgi:hypothetical protein
MNYVMTKTEEALQRDNINTTKFYAYKAIKVLQTSTKQFDECGCEDAENNIDESLYHLKAAVKSTSLDGTRVLLEEALVQIITAINAIDQHQKRNVAFVSKDFAMNTSATLDNKLPAIEPTESALYRKIDSSLVSYQKSINVVIDSVDCKVAKKFVANIYQQCEEQLLKENLSEGKKYYNLKTKEITQEALFRLGECGSDK